MNRFSRSTSFMLFFVALAMHLGVHSQSVSDLNKYEGEPRKPIGQFTACENFNMAEAVSKAAIEAYQEGQKSLLNIQSEYPATMGWLYLLGCQSTQHGIKHEIQQNFVEAKYWLDWAIIGGDATAVHNLAWMYQNGLGVTKDKNKAVELYRKALSSDALNPAARKASQQNLALLDKPASGGGKTSNPSANTPPALIGALMQPDLEEARNCSAKETMLDQASRFAISTKKFSDNDPNYLKMRCRATVNGKPGECKSAVDYFAYAGYYHSHCAASKDYEEAKYWFELGDMGDEASSISNLAWLHQNGLGTPKNELLAATLYQKLIDLPQYSPAFKKIARENLALIPKETAHQQAAVQPEKTRPTTNESQRKPSEEEQLKPSRQQQRASSSVAATMANRRALVIGNDSYKSVTKLINAREDAKAIAANLTTLGYQVTLKTDLSEKDMKAALRVFSEQVQGGDEVLFFFAGHGVQLGAANYLLPIDISGESEAQVKDESIQLQRILDDMSEKKAKFTLAMVDACRDNPFKTSGRAIGGRGLAPTTAATGQMVVFSAGTGQQALDRLGKNDTNKNGVFTRTLLKEMQKPGVSIDRIVKNVRNEVAELAKSVGHEQVPAIYDQVLGDFYFKK